MHACVLYIYTVGRSSRSAPFFPETSRSRGDIWLELKSYYPEGQRHERRTLFSMCSQELGEDRCFILSAFSLLGEKMLHTMCRGKVENSICQTRQTLLPSRWEETVCAVYFWNGIDSAHPAWHTGLNEDQMAMYVGALCELERAK